LTQFLDSLFILVDGTGFAAGCIPSGRVNTVRWVDARCLAMTILTAYSTNKVACTSLLGVPKFLASEE
jgi:hypothetical protein